ncbi:Alpha/Beta hydrolase protein [Staphylotrichum tortipilum]|uniref:Alpha/Beta hydrolase protein n=1 Tax=Staphylotrichum tortipilum TaxID=2831512 RepID=A0AAN6MPG8_9PEZI|nr:Alpha/Beta hydrolase protein [Staphylotrichum longicolle]
MDGQPTRDAVLRQQPPFLTKLKFAGSMYGLKSFLAPMHWLREWQESRNPPAGGPDLVKTYDCRPNLPIRVFLPPSNPPSHPLPTLFTIHGGGFCIGHQRDDDEWNRAFATRHACLVISLNYSKAPTHPFPTALHDLEVLLLASLSDPALPIDRTTPGRVAILGFSAGGNLALGLAQLETVRGHALAPAAAVSVYGCLDLSVPPAEKAVRRPWRRGQLALPRGAETDALAGLAEAFDWAYLPVGLDLRDPVVSPFFADKGRLPPFVGVVGAELDMLAHEGWGLARRLAGSGAPREGEGLVRGDERYGFEVGWEDKGRSGGVKWLLVPDVVHGFDNQHIRAVMGRDEETEEDAKRKTVEYVDEMARWLKEVVWRV